MGSADVALGLCIALRTHIALEQVRSMVPGVARKLVAMCGGEVRHGYGLAPAPCCRVEPRSV